PAISQYQAPNVSATQQALEQCRADLARLERQGGELRDELAGLNAQLAQLQQQLGQAQEQAGQLESQWQQQVTEQRLEIADAAGLRALQQGHDQTLAHLQGQMAVLDAQQAELARAREAREQAERALTEIQQRQALLQRDLDNLAARQGEQQQRRQQLEQELARQQQTLRGSLEGFARELPPNADAWLAEQEQHWRAWQQAQEQDQQLHEQQREAQRLLTEAEALAQQWQQRWQEEGAASCAEPPHSAEPEQSLQRAVAELAGAQREGDALRGREQSQQVLREQTQARLAEAQQHWQQALLASPFVDLQAFLAARLDEAERERLAALQQRLERSVTEGAALLAAAEAQLQRLAEAPQSELSLEQLDEQMQALQLQLRELSQRQGELRAQLQADDARRSSQQALFAEIAAQESEQALWQQLNGLIGSADGAKFRRFAQGLTLDHLIHLANRQ